VKLLLDTNAVIYLQKGLLADPLPQANCFVSVITEMELRSFPGLTTEQEKALRDLLTDVVIVGLTEEIKEAAIQLRRHHRLRLPDAVIAASAMVLDAELLTNDARLSATPGVRSRQAQLKNS